MSTSNKKFESISPNTKNSLSELTFSNRFNRSRVSVFTGHLAKPVFFIGGYNAGAMVESILIRNGWRRIYDQSSDDFTLKWTEQMNQINYYRLKPNSHLVNHIPNCAVLTNKLGLLLSLRSFEKYCQSISHVNQFNMNDFVPKTYIVDDLKERMAFYKEFKAGDIWINKPVGSNQGKGIQLIRNLEVFKSQLLDRDYLLKSALGYETRIVQRYICNPLLIEGRKFDIRCYMLIASTIPYLVLFHHGYIRLSLNQYSNSDESLITHLTNQFIQKQSPKYNDVKETTIWTFQKFNEYFNRNYKHLSNFKQDWVKTDLIDYLKALILHVFKSVKQRLANSTCYFEIYGVDCLIDDNLKVWLIEANSNPSMSIGCSILKEIIPAVLEETLMIVLECFRKNIKSNENLLPLANLKSFQVIFSESLEFAQSRKTLYMAYKSWSAPRYNINESDSKTTFSDSSWTGKAVIPFHARLSMPHKPNDNILARWKNQINDDRPVSTKYKYFSLGLKTPHQINTPRLIRSSEFSGDANLLLRDVQQNIHTEVSYSLRNKLENYKLSNLLAKDIPSAVTQNKLKEILKNY